MNLTSDTTQAISLTLTDANGAAVDLTGVTEVRAILNGSITIGPMACAVTNAAAGIITVPLTAADKSTPGDYRYEIEARWGNTRLSGIGNITLRPLQMALIGVIQGDTPTIILQVPGTDLVAAASVLFQMGSTPATATATTGTLTIPAPGGNNDQVAITLSAIDTATAGIKYARLLIDGDYTMPIQIDISLQALI